MSVIDPYASNTPPGVVRIVAGPTTPGTPAPIIPPPEPNPVTGPTPSPTTPNPFGPQTPLTDAQHQQNFMHLWKINSAAAYDYLSQGGRGAIQWGQRNQQWMRDNLFNGDQYAMNQWRNDSETNKNNMYSQADPGFQQYVNDLSNGKKTPSGTPWDPAQGVTPWSSGAQFNPFATAAGGNGGGYAPGSQPGTQNTPFVPRFGYNPWDPGYHGTNNYDPTTGTYKDETPMANTAPISVPDDYVVQSSGRGKMGVYGPPAPDVTVPTVTNNNTPSTVNPYVTTPGRGGYRYRNPVMGVT